MIHNYMLTPSSITVVIDGEPYTANKDHYCFDEIKEIVLQQKYVDTEEFTDMFKPINKLKRITTSAGDFECDNYGNVSIEFKGTKIELPNNLASYILDIHAENGNLTALHNFCIKLADHPDKSIFDELFGFMQKNGFVMNSLGNILAYKIVRNDFKDKYTGTFDNSPGQIVEMARQGVVRDSNRTCSAGLHFCAHDYLNCYGSAYTGTDKVVIVEIDPRDVVSIPTDYNNAKARCCKYKVLKEVTTPKALEERLVWEAEDYDDYDYDEDDEYTDWD